MPLVASGGGRVPFKKFVNFFAACTMASAGVTVGDVMYLCLNTTDSSPRRCIINDTISAGSLTQRSACLGVLTFEFQCPEGLVDDG